MVVDESVVISRYESCGQGHVVRNVSMLSESDKVTFLKQLDSVEVERLSNLYESAIAADNNNKEVESSECCGHDAVVSPFSKNVGRTTYGNESSQKAYKLGSDAISRGDVGVLVLAGGQGTRLGFDGPKGMYDIGLPSGRTLFQMLAERLKFLTTQVVTSSSSNNQRTSSCPFYIMTSPINHEETVTYFRDNNYFGLSKTGVLFFQQGMLPCLTDDGKIILETSSRVSMAPDGNGGIYPSLKKSGMFDDMLRRQLKYLHVFSIDNVLTKIADPRFIGYCIMQNSDCGNKVVWKTGPHEKVDWAWWFLYILYVLCL